MHSVGLPCDQGATARAKSRRYAWLQMLESKRVQLRSCGPSSNARAAAAVKNLQQRELVPRLFHSGASRASDQIEDRLHLGLGLARGCHSTLGAHSTMGAQSTMGAHSTMGVHSTMESPSVDHSHGQVSYWTSTRCCRHALQTMARKQLLRQPRSCATLSRQHTAAGAGHSSCGGSCGGHRCCHRIH